MDLDDDVCLCFSVTKRKLVNFIRLEQPAAASQLAECFGAGTGCGWCRGYLRKLYRSMQSQLPNNETRYAPNQGAVGSEDSNEDSNGDSLGGDSGSMGGDSGSAELTPEQYAAAREAYMAKTGRRPPSQE